MRRHIVVFTVVLLLTIILISPAYAATAKYFGISTSGDKYYFFPGSISISDEYISVKYYCDFKEVDQDGVKGCSAYVFLRPNERQWRIHSVTVYDINGNELDAKTFDNPWVPIKKGSMIDLLLKAVLEYTGKSLHQSKVTAFGSGFFITPSVVVTNHHVIDGASKVEIVYNNEVRLTATVIAKDENSDVALLKVYGLEHAVTPLVLSNWANMREGSRVYAVGFPLPTVLGTQAKLSEGIITGTSGLQGGVKTFLISTPVQPGSSGGPLLNDRGEVVGIVTGGLNAAYMLKERGIVPQNVNYAVKPYNIFNLINNSGLDLDLAKAQTGNTLSAVEVMDIARKAVVLVIVSK